MMRETLFSTTSDDNNIYYSLTTGGEQRSALEAFWIIYGPLGFTRG